MRNHRPFTPVGRAPAALLAMGLAVVAPLLTGNGGEISGRILLKGAPPPEKLVDLSSFPQVTDAYPHLAGKLTTRHYVVAPHGGLANVFVYVKSGLEGRSFPLSTNRPVLDQTNAGFYPYVIGVMTNQTLLIKNSEPYMDNPMATPSRNKEFNLGQPVTGMISPVRFDQPEVLIRVKCGVHAWEFAFVGVVESPFFGVSGTNGDYRLPPDLPPGRYVIEAVHPKAGRVTKEVVLGQDEKRSLDFTMEVPAKPPTPAR